MKIEMAYSLEYQDLIDSEEACDLYWQGVISDKTAFECPGENCTAAVTCANMDRLKWEMKQVPHFRLVGTHSPKCSLPKEIVDADKVSTSGHEKKGIGTIDNKSDIFMLQRPKSHFYRRETGQKPNGDEHNSKEKNRKKRNFSKKKIKPATYYSVKYLVSKFVKYSSEQSLKKHFINIKGFDISYNDMFIAIDGQNLDELSEYSRIYYGEVTVIKLKNSENFIVKFKNTIGYDNKEICPSIFISNNLIEKQFLKGRLKELLIDFTEIKNKSITCFVYGKFKLNNKNEMDYINMPIYSMDFMDFRVG